MRTALLAVLLAAAPPSAQKARELASSQSWEELYLAFSATSPASYSKADAAAVAAALLSGCRALEGSDGVMAYSLGEKAVAFQQTAEGLLCVARSAHRTDQRDAAEQALRRGLAAYPKNGAFALELGRALLEDRDPRAAIAALRQTPRGPWYAEAQALLRRAQQALSEDRSAMKEAKALERRAEAAATRASTSAGAERATAQPAGLTYESGVGPGGMRTRSNSRFTLKYFNNERDFGQRADYEGRVVAALDEAYGAARDVLGQARASPVDVVLYTREEFTMHFSSRTAERVAGLYFDNSIRINDAAELTQQARATLVHEYIHAVVDELAQSQASRLPTWLNEGLAEYVEWRYLGSDGPPYAQAVALRGAAKAGRLPQLAQMDRGALVHSAAPALAYAASGVAVRLLIADGGPAKLLELIREIGEGAPFERALEARYGRTLPRLQEELRDEVSRR
jgi:hypothetical protein